MAHHRTPIDFTLMMLFAWLASGTAAQSNTWKKAEREIKRLDASAFLEVPTSFRMFIQRKHCAVPQTFAWKEPHNIIRGEFAKKRQTDWAALCSNKAGSSSIVIQWGGPTTCPGEIEPRKDETYLQQIWDGKIGYSRNIQSISWQQVRLSFKSRGEPVPSINLDHDCLNDAFVDKASTIYCCHEGKWLPFQGSD